MHSMDDGKMRVIFCVAISGVITDGDIRESPMVKLMGDIRELFVDSRCHFNKINLDFYTPFC